MSHLNKVSIFAPASMGNVTVGFDILGLAVKPIDGTLLGDVVTIEEVTIEEVTEEVTENTLIVVGKFSHKLSSNHEDNIVWSSLLIFNQALINSGKIPVLVKITLDKKMPVGSGLGSSACSVVAALVALNRFYEKYYKFSFDKQTLLKMMGKMEEKISGSLHYDNVAPCYLGGLQLMVPDNELISRALPSFNDCFYVMAYPGIEVSTKAARDVLPTSYSRSDVISFGQNIATFVDACHRQDKVQAFSVLKDVVAEPYRVKLLPKYQQASDYLISQGSLAVGISGSGPTLFCVCDNIQQAQQFASWLIKHYLQQVDGADGIENNGFVHICKVDEIGAEEV